MLPVVDYRNCEAELARLEHLMGSQRAARLRASAAAIRDRLDGGRLWHVNSTGTGGGVAELLHTVLPLYRALGVAAGWIVVDAEPDFFTVSKRLGATLYGSRGDGGRLGGAERRTYGATLAANAERIRELVRPNDVLLLHDHQTAGLAAPLRSEVAEVHWRCHVGVDEPNAHSEMAWDFLAPFLDEVDGVVFSIDEHVPQRLRDRPVHIDPPFISPFTAKNRELDPATIDACIAHCGLSECGPPDGFRLRNPVAVSAESVPDRDEPLVVQISRWDELKDMHGVLSAFVSHVDEGHLVLAGPDPASIADDVEQQRWYERCAEAWRGLPRARRARASLLCLPMADPGENALLVNALQRRARIVTQKSLAEGFGLTVTEAMWKSKPVLASAVGGIRSQITHGRNGFLVDDPTDLPAFGEQVADLVNADGMPAIAESAHRTVRDSFLPDREIVATAEILGQATRVVI